MSDKITTPRRREPFEARGRFIWGGPTEHDAMVGEVYDNGQPFPEEMAKVWAASYQIMFPALAEIRNASAIAAYATAEAWPEEAAILLERIHQRAKDALPAPTIGDVNGTAPEAPRRSSVQEAAPATAADGLTETSDLPPGLLLVATPYREAPDKWMLVEMAGPGRANVITGGYIETEEEGVAHAHSFAGALSAARAVAPAGVPEWVVVPAEANTAIRARAESRAIDFGLDFDKFGGDEAIDALYLSMVSVGKPAAPTAQGHDPLGKVRQAIADYHYALDARQHGGTAAHQAIDAIKAHLGIAWEPGAELARRSSAPSAGEA